jgi:hypothetical protein
MIMGSNLAAHVVRAYRVNRADHGPSPLITLNSSWLALASRYTSNIMHHASWFVRGTSGVIIPYRDGEAGDIVLWKGKRDVT